MINFREAIGQGHLDGDAALLYTYGLYLIHGGTYEGFMDLDWDDVQIMFSTYEGTRIKSIQDIIKGIASLFSTDETEAF